VGFIVCLMHHILLGGFMTKFKLGQIMFHKLFHYRGVILKVDETFKLTNEWYDLMAKSKPPKDKPWYHIIVDNKTHMTYVAERNLQPDHSSKSITHFLMTIYFTEIIDGIYQRNLNWEGDDPVPVGNFGSA
jgi:heat shock protein HspQ